MKINKYSEPWKVSKRQVSNSVEKPFWETEAFIQDSNGFIVAECSNSLDYYENHANAARIVDCVNSCAGYALGEILRGENNK